MTEPDRSSPKPARWRPRTSYSWLVLAIALILICGAIWMLPGLAFLSHMIGSDPATVTSLPR